jgi:hypothetical protein
LAKACPIVTVDRKGEVFVGNSIDDKTTQKQYIKNRMDLLLQTLDTIDAETAVVEEIDRIISMLDDLEQKCKQFRYNWES